MAAGDAGAFILNIVSSVFIISVNKRLMGSPPNFNFRYVVTLNALHYITTSIWTRVAKVVGLAKQEESSKAPAHVPLSSVVLFTTVSNASIISLNTSLMLNSITLYQIAKLGIIPCTCCVEYLLYGRVFTSKMVLAIVVTLMGVGLVSINELNYSDSTLGVFVALCSVVSSSGQQLLVRHLQLKHNVSAGQLLGVVAPAQGASLLLLSPFLDKITTGGFVTDYDWTQGAMVCMALSCSAAVLVNVSQFLVLGRFTAVTYQVLGHAKTVCVLVVGYVFFGGVITGQQLLGMVMAIAGMMAYSRASQAAPAAKPAAQEEPDDESSLEDLLQKNKANNV
jgi:solute carrier family 35 protein E3